MNIKSNLIFFILIILVTGLSLSACYHYQVGQPDVVYTSIPTLIPATPVDPIQRAAAAAGGGVRCQVRAVDLLGAWVEAGYSESEIFTFIDENGKTCEANFHDDVQQLFIQGNLWFDGAPACVSCHNEQLLPAYKSMDLSSYEGILAGSQRTSGEAQGFDILAGGNWEESLLYSQLINRVMPLGRPPDSPARGPIVFAGKASDNSN